MSSVAPNLCACIGKTCAAKVIAAAGGLTELSRTPACNIQVMGTSKKSSLGLSKVGSSHHGFFAELEIVKQCPQDFKTRLVKMLANNCAKASRVDFAGGSRDGSLGRQLYDEMTNRLEKIQAPTQSQRKKPLEFNIDRRKARRGGKKYRKMKERYGLTDIRKMQNRVLMDPTKGQVEDEMTGTGFGMLGQANSGVLKVDKKKQKQNLNKKQKKILAHKIHSGSANPRGMVSTLVMAPNQGIQLVDPAWVERQQNKGQESAFFAQGGFKTVVRDAQGR